jgi:hypothetical protein
MASRLKFVKALNDPKILNFQQLYYSIIFGDNLPGLYDENKIYMSGDAILKLNEYNVYDVYISLEDEVTGPFNGELWQKISLTEIIKNGDIINGGGKNLIMISDVQPEVKNNKIWLQEVNSYNVNSNVFFNK